eukprot:gene5852-11174_t
MAGVESLCVLGQSKPIVENKTKSVISSTKLKNMKNRPIEKVFTASGQAPSPSKDFFELIIAKDRVIWRAWRIKYKNHRMIMPSEECISYDEFQDDNRIQTEIFRNLGDDVLQVSLGYVSREWIARLPSSVLRNIAAYLSIKDITVLSQSLIPALQSMNSSYLLYGDVPGDVLAITGLQHPEARCRDSQLWQECYCRTFGAWDDLRERRAKKIGWRKVFIEEWERLKDIDWDDL